MTALNQTQRYRQIQQEQQARKQAIARQGGGSLSNVQIFNIRKGAATQEAAAQLAGRNKGTTYQYTNPSGSTSQITEYPAQELPTPKPSEVASEMSNYQQQQKIQEQQGAVVTSQNYVGDIIHKPSDIRDQLSFKEKIGSVVSKYSSGGFYTNIFQQTFGVGSYQSPAPLSAFGTFISPFDVFKSTQTVGEFRPFVQPYSGTGNYNPKTGQYETPIPFQSTTGYERLQMEELQGNFKPAVVISQEEQTKLVNELRPSFQSEVDILGKKYQQQIDTGQISYGEAKTKYGLDVEQISKNYQSEFEKRFYSRVNPRVQYSEGLNMKLSELNKPMGLEPSTLVVGGLVIGSGFATGGLSIGMGTLTSIEGETNVLQGISTKNYPQIALGGAMFIGGTYSTVRELTNQITQAQIESSTMQTPKFQGGIRQNLGRNRFMDVTGYKQSSPSAIASTKETVFTNYYPSTKEFYIQSGTSETIVQTTDFWTGKPLTVGAYRTFTGQGMMLPKGTLSSGNIPISMDRFVPSVTGLRVTEQYTYNIFRGGTNVFYSGAKSSLFVGAEATRKGRFLYSKSGELTESPMKTLYGKGGKMLVGETGKYEGETFSKIKVFKYQRTPLEGFSGRTPPRVIYFTPTASETTSGSTVLTQVSSFNLPSTSLPSSSSGLNVLETSTTTTLKMSGVLSIASKEVTSTKQRLSPMTLSGSIERQKTFTSTTLVPRATTIPGGSQRLFGGSASALSQPSLQLEKQISTFGQAEGLVSPPVSPGFNFTPSIFPPFLFNTPKLNFDWGIGSRTIKGKKGRRKYTPSYEALVFNIKGSIPRGVETGQRVRPIPKGFKWEFGKFKL